MKLCMLINLQKMNNFYWDHFCNTKKSEHGGRLKLKINVLLHGDKPRTVTFRLMKFDTLKYHGYTYKFYLNYHFLWRRTFQRSSSETSVNFYETTLSNVPEDNYLHEDSTFTRNVGVYLQVHTALQPRRQVSTPPLQWELRTHMD
jgi:hypothetical protein